jgi:hypothetical protein
VGGRHASLIPPSAVPTHQALLTHIFRSFAGGIIAAAKAQTQDGIPGKSHWALAVLGIGRQGGSREAEEKADRGEKGASKGVREQGDRATEGGGKEKGWVGVGGQDRNGESARAIKRFC